MVTGAASGIGRALCLELLRAGATVHGADRDAAGLAKLQQAADGLPLRTRVVDVSDADSVAELIDGVVRGDGRLDYLFNNAGVLVGGAFEATDEAAWRRIVDINLWGVVHGTRFGYAQMLGQGRGHIINTASSAGVLPVAKSTAYATTKHAVVGLSVSLRAEAAARGVRVSVVLPGMVDTAVFGSAHNVGGHDYQKAVDKVPFRKITPERAARDILAGVAKNKQYITFPAYNRIIIGLHRLAPAAMSRIINR